LRLLTVLLLMLALVLASCGGSSSQRSTVSSAPGPTGTTGPNPQPKTKGGSSGSRPAGGTATASPQKISFREKSFFGALSQVTYFVERRGAGGALAQARDCVRRNLAKVPSAYCYAFSTLRALRFSRISPRPPARMRRACWSAYWGKPKGRPPLGSGSNPAASALRCPDAAG
jgi:hypothetical protein